VQYYVSYPTYGSFEILSDQTIDEVYFCRRCKAPTGFGLPPFAAPRCELCLGPVDQPRAWRLHPNPGKPEKWLCSVECAHEAFPWRNISPKPGDRRWALPKPREVNIHYGSNHWTFLVDDSDHRTILLDTCRICGYNFEQQGQRPKHGEWIRASAAGLVMMPS